MIQSYKFGEIRIDGKTYNHDLIIFGNKITDWWREEGHVVDIKDLKNLPESFDVLVIGNGASGVCDVPQKTIDYVKDDLGVELIIKMTSEAVKTYNKLKGEGKRVVGAFHLTC